MTTSEASQLVAAWAEAIASNRRALDEVRRLGDDGLGVWISTGPQSREEWMQSTANVVRMYVDMTRAVCERHGLQVPPEAAA